MNIQKQTNNKSVLIVGTGTIGEPLIGLLADFKNKLKIGKVYFHKRTPLTDEYAKVESLISRGAKLVTNKDCKENFEKIGHKVSLTFDKALDEADVIVDCTPAGNKHKDKHYLPLDCEDTKRRIYIAQGSEKGFGTPYAYGINDDVLQEHYPNFIQVVSCNTHNIACLIDALSFSLRSWEIIKGDFVCIRRANDISQDDSFAPAPTISEHKDVVYGTHHARDACDLFRTQRKIIDLFSSAMKTNTQYMHSIRFNIRIKGGYTKQDILNQLYENKFVTLTEKTSANKVFSFGRDHGYYGRIFNQAVVVEPSLHVRQYQGETQVSGFCFTPQDGNSLLSSIAAILYGLHDDAYIEYMKQFDKYLFKKI